ncbi:MAG: endolytic transglycosylase MltG [Erysipelotrichaceae bacterium]|nr:endolytic transglycosylase MltG [Erysipelotrichaceae bacterium]
MKKKTKSPYKGKIALIVILSILLLATGGFAFLYRHYLDQLEPVSEQSEEIAFTIEENSTMNAIINKLYDEGLIRNKDMAKIYVKLNRKNSYYAGNFILNRNMSFPQIMDTISDMSKASRDQVSVTITPGSWAKHAAAAIAEKTNLTAEEILAKWDDPAYVDTLIKKYEVLSEDIFNSERCYLEGYIFPETYKFYENTTVEQVTEKILDQTEKIYEKYKDKIGSSEFSTHEVFTLASVILFEANTEEDMLNVSGVFYNRFAKGMKMQSSVTVCYALYQYDNWSDCEKNSLVVDSKYNTYLYPGLPIGPVCNPTEAAIKAAVEPAQNDYYYFVADLTSGRCVFAKTYEEHLKNIKKYLGK